MYRPNLHQRNPANGGRPVGRYVNTPRGPKKPWPSPYASPPDDSFVLVGGALKEAVRKGMVPPETQRLGWSYAIPATPPRWSGPPHSTPSPTIAPSPILNPTPRMDRPPRVFPHDRMPHVRYLPRPMAAPNQAFARFEVEGSTQGPFPPSPTAWADNPDRHEPPMSQDRDAAKVGGRRMLIVVSR